MDRGVSSGGIRITAARAEGPWFLKPWIAVLGSTLVAVLLISSLSQGGRGGLTSDRSTADPVPVPSAVQPLAEGPTAGPVDFEPITFTGSGDAVERLAVPPGADASAIITVESAGAGNFVVWALDPSLGQDRLVFNEIGPYSGSKLIDTAAAGLQIEAEGPWTATVAPLTSAPELGPVIEGSGAAVLRNTAGPGAAAVSHTGAGSFALWQRAPGEEAELLLSGLGDFAGETDLPADPVVLVVEAEGEWVLRLE